MVTLFENPHESPLAMFLMQVFITLIVCKILAKLLSFIRQPQVIGQIIAGIIFGPSILGRSDRGCSSLLFVTAVVIHRLRQRLVFRHLASIEFEDLSVDRQSRSDLLHVLLGLGTRFGSDQSQLESDHSRRSVEYHLSRSGTADLSAVTQMCSF